MKKNDQKNSIAPNPKSQISLEYSYIDVNTSTLSSMPGGQGLMRGKEAQLSPKRTRLEASSHLSKQDSFTILNNSMFIGLDKTGNSNQKVPSSSRATNEPKRASLLLRPKRQQTKPSPSDLPITFDLTRRAQLAELFRSTPPLSAKTNQSIIANDSCGMFSETLLCSHCIHDLHAISSTELHHVIQEFHRLDKYKRNADELAKRETTTNLNLNPNEKDREKEKEKLRARNEMVELHQEREQLEQEIQLLEKLHKITQQFALKQLEKEIVSLQGQLEKLPNEAEMEYEMDSLQAELDTALQSLQIAQLEQNIWETHFSSG